MRRRLDDHLVLVVVLQPKRVVTVAAVGRPSAWLDVGSAPGLRADSPQKRGRMKGAGPHLLVIGLHDDAAAIGPVLLQEENQVLEAQDSGRRCRGHGWNSWIRENGSGEL